MLVKISSPGSEGSVEWAMIELNGELILPEEKNCDSKSLELGSIRFTSSVSARLVLSACQ